MTDVAPKKRGRPPKNRVVVEQTDSQTGEVIATYDDPGEEVELPEALAPELRAELAKEYPMSAPQRAALDRDYDGQAGGSRPKASLTDLQRQAFVQDAEDAYQQQVEIKRTDGFNRVWTFRHVIVDNRDTMQLRVDRGPVFAERLVSCAFYTVEIAEASIREIDRETAR